MSADYMPHLPNSGGMDGEGNPLKVVGGEEKFEDMLVAAEIVCYEPDADGGSDFCEN